MGRVDTGQGGLPVGRRIELPASRSPYKIGNVMYPPVLGDRLYVSS